MTRKMSPAQAEQAIRDLVIELGEEGLNVLSRVVGGKPLAGPWTYVEEEGAVSYVRFSTRGMLCRVYQFRAAHDRGVGVRWFWQTYPVAAGTGTAWSFIPNGDDTSREVCILQCNRALAEHGWVVPDPTALFPWPREVESVEIARSYQVRGSRQTSFRPVQRGECVVWAAHNALARDLSFVARIEELEDGEIEVFSGGWEDEIVRHSLARWLEMTSPIDDPGELERISARRDIVLSGLNQQKARDAERIERLLKS